MSEDAAGSPSKLVLVTGATGYIGGRLAPRLLEAGYRVRVFVRSPEKLADVPWADRVEIVQGDLGDPGSLAAATVGVDLLYYLVHSMGAKGDFEATERTAARNVASAARTAGVRRIVYLGGLHPADGALSKHLRSRREVGEVLLTSGVPTIALKAGVIIGSGSTSFEMIRHLTEVLPYMPAPYWVRNHIQPIAVRDVLYYLLAAAAVPGDVNRTFDIGGPDVLRYGQMMNGYAVEAGLKQRPIASIPVFAPRLAAHWVNVVTPIPRRLAVPIIESLQYDCVALETDIRELIPDPEGGLTSYRDSVRLALGKERAGEVETSWQNSSVMDAPSDPLPSDPEWAGHTVYTDIKERHTDAPVDALWRVIESIGGDNGWYSLPVAWAARGLMDKMVGGVGLRRGRRNQERLQAGDALDFWRVEAIERGRLLRLRAEMKLPGLAWLELRSEPDGNGGSVYHQRAVFFPLGLGGRLYWLSILPFHGIIFTGMANRITATAARRAGLTDGSRPASAVGRFVPTAGSSTGSAASVRGRGR
jgi:uncharacterized protein YbjT (DUF2867 family)